MACTFPQDIFNENLNLNVSINISGTTATLWLQNMGLNILQLTRILLGGDRSRWRCVGIVSPSTRTANHLVLSVCNA